MRRCQFCGPEAAFWETECSTLSVACSGGGSLLGQTAPDSAAKVTPLLGESRLQRLWRARASNQARGPVCVYGVCELWSPL